MDSFVLDPILYHLKRTCVPRSTYKPFRHELHPLTVLTTAELHDLVEKRAELRKYTNTAKSWAEVNKGWLI